MNDRQPQSTLREWRHQMTHPKALCVFVGVAVVLAIMGPFGSDALLRPLPRFAYWLLIVVSTYSAGYLVNAFFTDWLSQKLPRYGVIAACAIGTGIAVSLIIALLNGWTLGYWLSFDDAPIFFGNVFVIAVVIAVVFEVVSANHETENSLPPAILDRLPFALRAPLIALSVEDHYVRVHTTRGNEMILMRLSDAMREVGTTNGLQVHRSHWVATDAIKSVQRKGDGAVLTLSNEIEIPVSRSNMPAIKAAGLLPKATNG